MPGKEIDRNDFLNGTVVHETADITVILCNRGHAGNNEICNALIFACTSMDSGIS